MLCLFATHKKLHAHVVAMLLERMIGVAWCDLCKIINKFVHNTTGRPRPSR